MKGLQGKVVIVTGGSNGIGKEVAIKFAEYGADVAFSYYSDEEGAAETEKAVRGHEARVIAMQSDVGNKHDVDRLFDAVLDQWGGLDFLINNAGIQYTGPAHEVTLEEFDRVIATNLRGAFICAQRAIQHFLAEDKPGVIINMSSVHQIIPKPLYISYSVSKGGMQNLTRTLALEYAGQKIRVNGIGPGATITPMNEAWVDDPDKRKQVESHIPMGRAGTAEEMAEATAFLCSDHASYITGQTLYVDGGLTLYPDFRTAWSSQG